ncbi:MAG: hypothetical protein AABW91_03160 [Nanoarchaeota archaeon]
MKTNRFSFQASNDETASKLIAAIEKLPEEVFEGLPANDKTIVDLRIEKGQEKIAITPPPYSGERLIINYPKGCRNPRPKASRECACFGYKGEHYKVIF